MATLIVRHRVRDYAAWKRFYDGATGIRDDLGVVADSVYQTKDDANALLIIHQFNSMAAAEAFVADPALADALRQSGVEGTPARTRMWTRAGGSCGGASRLQARFQPLASPIASPRFTLTGENLPQLARQDDDSGPQAATLARGVLMEHVRMDGAAGLAEKGDTLNGGSDDGQR